MRLALPGFVDVHVHFRDPGAPEAETTASGMAAARRGGFAAVVAMPNTVPPIDTASSVKEHTRVGEAGVKVFSSGAITRGRKGVGEVADLEAMAAAGAAFFTDDGGYVADAKLMEEAMRRSAVLGMTICEHAMEPTIIKDGVIRDCALARRLGLPIIPAEAETVAIERDLAICRVTGCRLHIQHISTARGVELVRSAQREGLPVTAEATPHHLLLSCDELTADDANYKMAPPLGNNEDRAELRKAVKEGVLMFATDHAPHPQVKKSQGFRGGANGIIGLETAIPITYSVMVVEEGMRVENWAKAWHEMPLSIIEKSLKLKVKEVWNDLGETTIEIGEKRKVKIAEFASRSRNCPYDGMELEGFAV